MRTAGISSYIKLATLAAEAIVLSLVFVSGAARATTRDFTIVTNQSSIAISGNVDGPLGSATIQPQGTGSLTTKYTGTIKTDRSASGVSFLSGSTIDANTNGNWKPLADGSDGSAAADYGGKATFLFVVTVNFAGRNLVAGLTERPAADRWQRPFRFVHGECRICQRRPCLPQFDGVSGRVPPRSQAKVVR